MIEAIIVNIETDERFETELKSIPRKDDGIGCWFNSKWDIYLINSIIHEFDGSGRFFRIEINVGLQR